MSSAKPRSALSLTEQLALLENPAPTDFDPESLEQEHWGGEGSDESEGSGDEGGHDGREHYVVVGKSKLRKGHTALLDPKYSGARVSREKLYDEDVNEGSESGGSEEEGEEGEKSNDESTGGIELGSETDIREGTPRADEDDEIDSDDALGSEEERFAGYQFRGSLNATRLNGAADSAGEGSGVDGNESEEDEENESGDDGGTENEDEDDTSDHDDDDDGEDDGEEEEEEEEESESESGEEEELARRDQLRKMMAEEQKNVVANISKAARADADKGAAVRQQQKTFDSFLSIRIKLQKALISTNSLTQDTTRTTSPETWEAAEQVALSLWNILHNHRSDLSDLRTGSKRKHDDVNETTTDALWTKMRKLDRDATPWRDSTLDKWSAKTASVATTSLAKKLNNSISTPRSLTASIRDTLSSDTDRLVARTRTPRSMAPTCTAVEDAEIFDDADFYQLLLKALVDRRMVDGGTAAGSGAVRWTTAMRDAKKKKVVDTKASKGRKLRYQVQEKIQNFMAPMENNGWHEQQIDELFSSLLGQKVRVDEEDEDKNVEDVDMDGLRLFRS